MRASIDRTVFILYGAFIAFISLRPMNSASTEPWDKVFHLVFYGVFAVLGYRIAKAPGQLATICIGIVAYGGLLEIAQSFMPGRVMSAYDLLANTMGVIAGAFVAKWALRANHIKYKKQ